MVLANQNAKLTGPDQGFLVSRLVLIWKPWERGCAYPKHILVPRALLTRGQPSATRGSGQIHIKLASDWPQRNIWFIVNMNKNTVRWKTRSRSSGVGAPESESRSRSPGVWRHKNMENTESYGKHGVWRQRKIWKTRSHMENTESTIKYGKHGVWRQRKIWKTRSLAYCQREIWKIVIK